MVQDLVADGVLRDLGPLVSLDVNDTPSDPLVAAIAALLECRVDLAAEADLVATRLAHVGRGDTDAARSGLVAHLAGLRSAVVRIDAGTYGTCELCERPIGPARLSAAPTSTRCITCASLG